MTLILTQWPSCTDLICIPWRNTTCESELRTLRLSELSYYSLRMHAFSFFCMVTSSRVTVVTDMTDQNYIPCRFAGGHIWHQTCMCVDYMMIYVSLCSYDVDCDSSDLSKHVRCSLVSCHCFHDVVREFVFKWRMDVSIECLVCCNNYNNVTATSTTTTTIHIPLGRKWRSSQIIEGTVRHTCLCEN